MSGVAREEVVRVLEELAPLALAGDWDNVGLLVEPSAPSAVTGILLTIDLSEAVLDEAIEAGARFIVAYHPPIFAPLNRLTQATDKQRVVVRALEAGVTIYSPHTALDAAAGWVNDWLADGLGAGDREAIEKVGEEHPELGQGRFVRLHAPEPLEAGVTRIKQHLGLDHLQVATASRHQGADPVTSVALCAGAGGSVIGAQPADLYWTGEMRHHEILAALAVGTSVVLCNHTNTERGYLEVFAGRLSERLPACECRVSGVDRDPLRVC